MDDRHASQSSFGPGVYGAPAASAPAGYDPAGNPAGGYGLPPAYEVPGELGMPVGFPPGMYPPGMYPPGYNPYLGTFAGPRYASTWVRIGAYLIDGLVVGVINFVAQLMFLGVAGTAMNSDDTGKALTASIALLVLIFVLDAIYFVSQEAAWGQTLGKRALGTKVIKADGSEMDVDAALIRYFFLFFAFVGLGGLVTLIMVSLSDTKQRLGDKVAGTIVVRVR